MPRYVAFLRGVSPLNAKMPTLKACFESAGFSRVRTVLSSGNIVFDSQGNVALRRFLEPPRGAGRQGRPWGRSEAADLPAIEHRAESAMLEHGGRSFYTIVRSVTELESLLAADPFTEHRIPSDAKRVVSFFRQPPVPRVALPLAQDLASVFLVRGREAFTAYRPVDKGPVFMVLIEKAFGKDVTTRTLDTVAKCAAA